MKVRRMWAIAVAALVIVPGPAHAGGAMWDWDEFAYEPGDAVAGGTSVWITSPQGRPEDGPYHAYLISWSYDWPRNSFPHVPESALYLTDINLDPYEKGAKYAHARISFTMPDVEPGEYAVFHCNDPCTKTFGDIMATPILVVASESEGRLIARIEELESDVLSLRSRLNRVVPRWNRRVESDVGERILELTDRLDVLEERVMKIQPQKAESETEALSYFAGGGLLGLATAGAALRRRHRG
ncbi:MAG: hypothetical protein ACRDJI_04185 [Actinomycetota bacterium]